VLEPEWSWEWTKVVWYTFTKVWNLWFNVSTDDITIPQNWTYLIICKFSIADLLGDLWLIKCHLENNNTYLTWNWKISLSYDETLDIIITTNLNRWDELSLLINLDEETADRLINSTISITKIS
jgi:hypothetical protein